MFLSPISTVKKGKPERQIVAILARGATNHTKNTKLDRWPRRLRKPNLMSRSWIVHMREKELGESGGNNKDLLMLDNNNKALFETRLSTDLVLCYIR